MKINKYIHTHTHTHTRAHTHIYICRYIVYVSNYFINNQVVLYSKNKTRGRILETQVASSDTTLRKDRGYSMTNY